MIKLTDIRLPIESGEAELRSAASSVLGLKPEDFLSLQVLRQAVDARHRGSVRFTYTVAVKVQDEAAALRSAPSGKAEAYEPPVYALPAPGNKELGCRPVVVGAGPAGMLAAWVLAKAGYRPIVLERGEPMERRISDVGAFHAGGRLMPESNVQFGEGGAGAFSDGKLTTRIRDAHCSEILKLLVRCGAPEDILFSSRPHVGTDKLWEVIPAVRREIEALGGEYRFSCAVERLIIRNGTIAGLRLKNGEAIDCQTVILAVGHSARDTIAQMYSDGIPLTQKPFAVGLRAEHPQRDIDRAMWGDLAGNPKLGAADYHVACDVNGRAVHSFCMCPGGRVVNASSEPNCLAVNGMSLRSRNGANANAAIVAQVGAADFGSDVLSGVRFQRELEEKAFALGSGWSAPAQRLGDFLANRQTTTFGVVKPTVRPAAVPAKLNGLLPGPVEQALIAGMRKFGTQLPGFLNADAVLTAVETRTSSPVRMPRCADMQAEGIAGLYPAGEGAGWAGGILSAAADGMRAAEALISQWRVKA